MRRRTGRRNAAAAAVECRAVSIPAVAAAFDAASSDYDAPRRRLIPCFDAFYGAAIELIAEWGPPPGARLLDLGAGTGLLAAWCAAPSPASGSTWWTSRRPCWSWRAGVSRARRM